jgi:hypothetical protein
VRGEGRGVGGESEGIRRSEKGREDAGRERCRINHEGLNIVSALILILFRDTPTLKSLPVPYQNKISFLP